MLKVIDSNSQWVKLFKDDPVRPYISSQFRCHQPDNISFVLVEGDKPLAVICCSFKSFVPSSLDGLLKFESSSHSNAIFYSVWSYSKGSGRRILSSAVSWVRDNYSHVSGFYTYSPLGSSVREFHLGLGAVEWRVNADSVNYRY